VEHGFPQEGESQNLSLAMALIHSVSQNGTWGIVEKESQ